MWWSWACDFIISYQQPLVHCYLHVTPPPLQRNTIWMNMKKWGIETKGMHAVKPSQNTGMTVLIIRCHNMWPIIQNVSEYYKALWTFFPNIGTTISNATNEPDIISTVLKKKGRERNAAKKKMPFTRKYNPSFMHIIFFLINSSTVQEVETFTYTKTFYSLVGFHNAIYFFVVNYLCIKSYSNTTMCTKIYITVNKGIKTDEAEIYYLYLW